MVNEYIEILKRHVAENPPNYGSNAHSILEMLFCYYHECNNTDTDAVKAAFEDLYQRMHGMPLREMDRIVDAVCILCWEHEKVNCFGVIGGCWPDSACNFPGKISAPAVRRTASAASVGQSLVRAAGAYRGR